MGGQPEVIIYKLLFAFAVCVLIYLGFMLDI